MQTDIYSAFDHFLARQLVAAYDRRKAHNPALDAAVALLRAWNGQMEKDLAAPFLITLAYPARAHRHGGERLARQRPGLRVSRWRRAVVEKLLRERPAGWFDDYDDDAAARAGRRREEGKRIQGRRPPRWQYGRYLRVRHRTTR